MCEFTGLTIGQYNNQTSDCTSLTRQKCKTSDCIIPPVTLSCSCNYVLCCWLCFSYVTDARMLWSVSVFSSSILLRLKYLIFVCVLGQTQRVYDNGSAFRGTSRLCSCSMRTFTLQLHRSWCVLLFLNPPPPRPFLLPTTLPPPPQPFPSSSSTTLSAMLQRV